MDVDRCPSCAAAVKPGAPWCTLCYADLRPAVAEPVEARVSVSAGGQQGPYELPAYAEAAALAELTALTTPSLTAPPSPLVGAPDDLTGAAGVATEDEAKVESTWPCLQCGAAVALSEMACPVCGGGFLKGMVETSLEAEVPGLSKLVGRYQRMGKGERLAAIFGLGAAVSLTFVALLAIVGIVLR